MIDANPWLSTRDVILFDQRGSGLVEPLMACPKRPDIALALLSIASEAESARLQKEDAGRCVEHLLATGHNAAAYTSVDSAADLHSLFAAMNVPRWNVYGVSYGTRLALEYMRRYPDDVRSVILDSVLPPQARLYEDDAANTHRAIAYLVEQCGAQKACNDAYPDLGPRLQQLIARLDEEPMLISRPHPTGRGDLVLRMNGSRMISNIYGMLYSRHDIEVLPRLIDAYDRGIMSEIVADAETYVSAAAGRDDFGDAMHLSVHCFEEMPFDDPARADALFEDYPLLRGLGRDHMWESFKDVCDFWRRSFEVVEVRASDNTPVSSDLPALILSGTYDPVAPPSYAHMAVRSLTNSHLFEFPHVGHGVLGHDSCANSIAQSFLEAPGGVPDGKCLAKADAPHFAEPAR